MTGTDHVLNVWIEPMPDIDDGRFDHWTHPHLPPSDRDEREANASPCVTTRQRADHGFDAHSCRGANILRQRRGRSQTKFDHRRARSGRPTNSLTSGDNGSCNGLAITRRGGWLPNRDQTAIPVQAAIQSVIFGASARTIVAEYRQPSAGSASGRM